jgi:hypothetical protein
MKVSESDHSFNQLDVERLASERTQLISRFESGCLTGKVAINFPQSDQIRVAAIILS